MEIKLVFLITSIIFGFLAFFPYLRSIFLRQTIPHEFTWLIWTITQGTAVMALWVDGGGLGSISLTLWAVLTFIIFLLSLNRGEKRITKSDKILLVMALSGIVVWWIFDNPLLAVILVSLVDIIGYGPTFRKSFNNPWSENILGWFLFMFSCGFMILSIENYSFLTTLYPASILLADIALILFLLIRRKSLKK